jgi:hypothetical protein
MGFGVGVRSKRFAMVLDTGVVTHLLTDEGMDECSATAAANLLSVLTPPPDEVEGEEMGEMVHVRGAVAGLVAGLVQFWGITHTAADTTKYSQEAFAKRPTEEEGVLEHSILFARSIRRATERASGEEQRPAPEKRTLLVIILLDTYVKHTLEHEKGKTQTKLAGFD